MISTRAGWRRESLGHSAFLLPLSSHLWLMIWHLTYVVSAFISIFPPMVGSLKTVPQLYLFTDAPRLTMGL